MRLHLILVGKTQVPGADELMARYLGRIGRSAKIEAHVVKPAEAVPGRPEDEVKAEEGRRILALYGGKGVLAACDERGDEMDSRGFAAWLGRLVEGGAGDIWFALGGALGLSGEVRGRAKTILSLSRMTLQHDIARIVLCEQIYRAFTILRGEPYHK